MERSDRPKRRPGVGECDEVERSETRKHEDKAKCSAQQGEDGESEVLRQGKRSEVDELRNRDLFRI